MTTDIAKSAMALERATGLQGMEIGGNAAAAGQTALVQARFIVARAQPRRMQQVRLELIEECKRPDFAMEDLKGQGNSALYRRPVGNGQYTEGLGIRYAELAERHMGNMMSSAMTVHDDDNYRIKYCFVLDLQTNNSWEDTISIPKTVERKYLKEGQIPISSRLNSNNEMVYLLKSTDDEILLKESNLVSKKLRTLILRFVPEDIKQACIDTIKQVRASKVAEDPDAYLRKVIDGMWQVNVDVEMLEEFLEHPIKQCTPVEITNLQGIWAALKAGETTWAEIMADKPKAKELRPKTPQQTQDQPAPVTASTKGVEATKAKVADEKVKQAAPASEPPPSEVAKAVENIVAAVQQKPEEPKPAPPVNVTQAPEPPTPKAEPVGETPPPAQGAAPAWVDSAPQAEPQVLVEQAPETEAPIPPLDDSIPKGKVIKKLQFPQQIKVEGEAGMFGPWNQTQLARAKRGISRVEKILDKPLTLESTIPLWFGVGLDDINSITLDLCTKVLEEWPEAK